MISEKLKKFGVHQMTDIREGAIQLPLPPTSPVRVEKPGLSQVPNPETFNDLFL